MTELFKALAHDNRLAILALLSNQPLCGCDLEENLSLTQSNISRHLSILKNANILKNYKSQQWIYYAINQEFINENEALWSYLKESFKKEPYVSLRKNFSVVSSCSVVLPTELLTSQLEKIEL